MCLVWGLSPVVPLTSGISCHILLHNVGAGSLGEETKGLCAWNTDSGLFDFGERTWSRGFSVSVV